MMSTLTYLLKVAVHLICLYTFFALFWMAMWHLYMLTVPEKGYKYDILSNDLDELSSRSVRLIDSVDLDRMCQNRAIMRETKIGT